MIPLYYSPGIATQPIWLDDVVCGREPQECVANCQQCPSGPDEHNCVHGEDLTISCSELFTSTTAN